MNKSKRIGMVGLIVCFLISLLATQLPAFTGHAGAVTSSNGDIAASNNGEIDAAVLTFIDRSDIQVTIGDQSLEFKDSDPYDHTYKYQPDGYACSGGSITFTGDQIAASKAGSPDATPAAVLSLETKPSTNESCSKDEHTHTINVLDGAYAFALFTRSDSNNIKSIDSGNGPTTCGRGTQADATKGYDFYDIILSIGCQHQSSTYTSQGTDVYAVSGSDSSGCKSQTIVNNDDAHYYALVDPDTGPKVPSGTKTVKDFPASADIDADADCFVVANYPLKMSNTTAQTGTTTLNSQTPQTCDEANPGEVFAWFICPVINSIDGLVDSLNDAVASLLTIDPTSDFGSNGQIKAVWNGVRILSTVLLVIIMLVMIISEAIGLDIFDAYAIRKILPRLVVAVIVMQLSWALFIYAIELTNDVGNGIQDILFAPFGGEKVLSFSQVLQSGGTNDAVGVGLFGAASLATVGGVAAAGFLNLFGIAMLAMGALISILIGFVVLIFRKILIVACIMLVPLALLAWILPGTQKYWKLWHETFTKLLLMFPLIMVMLASGRIFAFITANTYFNNQNGLDGAIAHDTGVQGLLNFCFVVIGFFGPFWLLPKAFEWGGRVFGAVTGAVNNKNRGVFDRSRKLLDSRRQTRVARGKRDAGERMRTGEGLDGRIGIGRFKVGTGRIGRSGQRFADRARTGDLDPTLRWADKDAAEKRLTDAQNLSLQHKLEHDSSGKSTDRLLQQIRTAPDRETAELFAQAAQKIAQISTASPSGTQHDNFAELWKAARGDNRYEAAAATARLIDSKQFNEVDAGGAITGGIETATGYADTISKDGRLYGSVQEQRPDLLPTSLGKAAPMSAAIGDLSAPAAAKVHHTFTTKIAQTLADPTASAGAKADAAAAAQGLYDRWADLAKVPGGAEQLTVLLQGQGQASVKAIMGSVTKRDAKDTASAGDLATLIEQLRPK